MARARMDTEWWHTAHLMALHVNMNRAKGKPMIDASEFHPLHVKRAKPARNGDISWLKALLPEDAPERNQFN
jgi:hypothetical protein